jgi:hypothetical protein
VLWLPLYRVWGQGVYKEEGSPDRRVMSLREVLANLACKLRCPMEHVWAWLSSLSCGHVMAWCYCAGRGDTVGTAVVHQSSCAMWSPLWSLSSSSDFLGHHTRVGSRPKSSITSLAYGVEGHDPSYWGRGSRQSRWPLSQGLRRGFHPIVGGIVHASCWVVSGRWLSYRLSPPYVVLSC